MSRRSFLASLALVISMTLGPLLVLISYEHDAAAVRAERVHANDVAQLAQDRSNYALCLAVKTNHDVLLGVVETAYMSNTPVNLAQLPPITQQVVIELAPYLNVLGQQSQAARAAVLARIRNPPPCRDPG